MYRIANTILSSAYEHYKSTGSLSYYYLFPRDVDKSDVMMSLDYIAEKGYGIIQGRAIASCYVSLTDKGISQYE